MRESLKRTFEQQSGVATSLFLAGSAAFLYLNLFFLPCTPVAGNMVADHWIYLMEAPRMLAGQVIYRDFFDLVFPGIQITYVFLFKLFGVRAWVPYGLLLILGISLTWLGLAVSKRVLSGAMAFLPVLLFLTFVYRNAFNATHHWPCTLLVMAALALLVERRSPSRLAVASVLCGVAAFFTQTRGALALLAFAIFLVWERRGTGKRWRSLLQCELLLAAPFAITLVVLNAYFVWKAGLQRFVFSTFTFLAKDYMTHPDNNWRVFLSYIPYSIESWYRAPLASIWLFVNALFPVVYVLFVIRYRRERALRPSEPWDRLVLIYLVGLLQFIGIAYAPSWTRMCVVALPALILFVWLMDGPDRFNRILRRLFWIAAIGLAIAEPLRVQTRWRKYVETPAGRVALIDPIACEEHLWLLARTRPGDYFYTSTLMDTYFLLHLQNPTEVFVTTPTGYTLPRQVRNIVEGLEKHRVRYALMDLESDLPYDVPLSADNLAPLREYLRTHYHVVKEFPNFDQMWERNQPPETASEPKY
jgi:hypothetical protein